MRSKVIQANIDVHTKVAETYARVEPHFRPENKAKVRGVLAELRKRCGGGKLLDIGCGTGFIIDLAKDLFDEVHGVDVTDAMLRRVDTSSGNVFLHNASAEQVPFPDQSFHMVSAYSFIHHTEDPKRVLKEAARVLKPGGICYIDCEPNKPFWSAMEALGSIERNALPPIVLKARDSVLEIDSKIESEFGIPKDTFQHAEYGKSILGGLDPSDIEKSAPSVGFRTCTVRHEWFLGQAEVMHGQSFEEAARVEAYLRSIAPLSNHLFKYLQFVLEK